MANEQNLLPGGTYKFTDEDREKARKSRLENLSKRKTFREVFDALLSRDFKSQTGETVSGVEAIAMRVFQSAMEGNLESVKIIRDSVGEKPIEKVMVSDVDPEVIKEVEEAVLGYENDEDTGDNIPAE